MHDVIWRQLIRTAWLGAIIIITAPVREATAQIAVDTVAAEPCGVAEYVAAQSVDQVYLAAQRCFYYNYAVTVHQRLRYNEGAVQRRAEAFQWQATTSKWIFALVVGLLTVSVALSVAQFFRKGDSAITLKVSSGSSFEITTGVVGFVILAFAMVMFYLYVDKVYQITTVAGVELTPSELSSPQPSSQGTAK